MNFKEWFSSRVLLETKSCPGCQAANPDNAKFCHKCGFNIQQVQAVSHQAPQSSAPISNLQHGPDGTIQGQMSPDFHAKLQQMAAAKKKSSDSPPPPPPAAMATGGGQEEPKKDGDDWRARYDKREAEVSLTSHMLRLANWAGHIGAGSDHLVDTFFDNYTKMVHMLEDHVRKGGKMPNDYDGRETVAALQRHAPILRFALRDPEKRKKKWDKFYKTMYEFYQRFMQANRDTGF